MPRAALVVSGSDTLRAMTAAVVIVAAGSGERLGAGMPKALVPLLGRPMLDWAVSAFDEHPDIDGLVVVAPAADENTAGTAAARADTGVDTAGGAMAGLADRLGGRAVVVAGGASRQESVRRGLAAVAENTEFVLIHDAARPMVPAQVISSVVAALRQGASAVIPVLPVTDTIKRVDGSGVVTGTLDRHELRAVQTPQGFQRSALVRAHQAALDGGLSGVTDDAGVMEAAGYAVQTVPGSPAAFKITTPHDLALAELLASR